MNIDTAVKKLNKMKHRDRTHWTRAAADPLVFSVENGHPTYCLTDFEAIATAEKYERDFEDPEGPVQT